MTVFTDASTQFQASVMNQCVAGDGVTGGATRGVMLIAQTIKYDSGWSVVTDRGLSQQSNITLTWEGASNRLKVDISGMDNTFSLMPAVAAVPFDNNVSGTRQYTPVARCTDVNTIYVKFYDDSTAIGPLVTSEGNNMSFTLWMLGKSL